MKQQLKDIKLGYGLGVLKFGMSRSQVKLILGEPSFIDKYSNSDNQNDLTESWEYDSLELSLSFDEEEDWKLTVISITSSFYELDNTSYIGIAEKEALQELKSFDEDALYLEDCSEQEGEDNKVIEIEEKSINFWFIDGVLDEIQWSPFFIDDDTIDWPA